MNTTTMLARADQLDVQADQLRMQADQLRVADRERQQMLLEDPWDDPVTNPYGCCRHHALGTEQDPGIRGHGGPGCWWPSGAPDGTRVRLADGRDDRAAGPVGTIVDGFMPQYGDARRDVTVAWDDHSPDTRGPLGMFAAVTD